MAGRWAFSKHLVDCFPQFSELTESAPLALENAPYLLASVASSCNAMPMDLAAVSAR